MQGMLDETDPLIKCNVIITILLHGYILINEINYRRYLVQFRVKCSLVGDAKCVIFPLQIMN